MRTSLEDIAEAYALLSRVRAHRMDAAAAEELQRVRRRVSHLLDTYDQAQARARRLGEEFDEMPKKAKPKPVVQPEVDRRTPPLGVLVKLGSIAVHADELLSPDGHVYDRTVLETMLRDPDVQAWIKSMGVLLPRKR